MTNLRFILGDQLSRSVSSLRDVDPSKDTILMVEVAEEATYVRHHKAKLVFIFSAMRHFAEELRREGLRVDYVRLDDPQNTGSFASELKRAIPRSRAGRVVITEPGEWRVLQGIRDWENQTGTPVEIREDDRFLSSLREFNVWAEGRKQYRMEFFYRNLRRKTGWLMNGDQPEGGRWNYDIENRKPLPDDCQPPQRKGFPPDKITREVMELVKERFAHHFGEINNFRWAVDRDSAQKALKVFIDVCLPTFGQYQDAMKAGEDFLYHSALSPYLNCGLLLPREVCESALQAFHEGEAPLAAVEGFIRQILGWREYIRGIYWLHMPEYPKSNYFNARRCLPGFYWTGDTEMRCMRETIRSTKRHAYTHHIQLLMITGNFALLAGIDPAQVEEWYLIVYADAFEWVELPNTHGMALHADGGIIGSKPYAASGAYINRMSDYCSGCAYAPTTKLGPKACPYNYLYWNFLMENQKQLEHNPRMRMSYRNLARMSTDRRKKIRAEANTFLGAL